MWMSFTPICDQCSPAMRIQSGGAHAPGAVCTEPATLGPLDDPGTDSKYIDLPTVTSSSSLFIPLLVISLASALLAALLPFKLLLSSNFLFIFTMSATAIPRTHSDRNSSGSDSDEQSRSAKKSRKAPTR